MCMFIYSLYIQIQHPWDSEWLIHWLGNHSVFTLSAIRNSLDGKPPFFLLQALLHETMKSILQPFWLNLDSKWKIASPLKSLFSFSHYFTTSIIYFFVWWIKCADNKLWKHGAKQNHHSFASHSLHFLHGDTLCGLPWGTWTSFSPEKKACGWGKKGLFVISRK